MDIQGIEMILFACFQSVNNTGVTCVMVISAPCGDSSGLLPVEGSIK